MRNKANLPGLRQVLFGKEVTGSNHTMTNKANRRYASKTIAKFRLTLPPGLSRAIVSNKPNSPLTRRAEQSQSRQQGVGRRRPCG
jgi:hypothetical protein